MIKKLRYRFLLITMACISFIFILILSVINVSMTFSSRAQGYSLLYRLADDSREGGRPVGSDRDGQAAGESKENGRTTDDDGKNGQAARESNENGRTTDGDGKNGQAARESNENGRTTDGDGKNGQAARESKESEWPVVKGEARSPAGREDDQPGQNIPHPGNPVRGFDAFRCFSVLYDGNGNITDITFEESSGFTEEDIRTLAAKVMENPRERGVVSKYLYITKGEETGTRLYFLDYSMEKALSLRLFWTCLWIGLIGILFIFILVFFLSRWMVLPVQNAFDRQKRFIADASHELKTPLTIITTNAEVLAGGLGDNKWLKHILEQTRRMSLLIKDLLELARLDSGREGLEFVEFDMSTAVKNAALSFESLAYEYGKKYELEIAEHILFTGNESGIRQLTTLLLDNAFKYSENGGRVALSLSQRGDKRLLCVENTGKGIRPEDQVHIFERFYRSDASRSRDSGGYGLGLSIAASIVKAHKGQIQVKSDGQSFTRFTVTLPSGV